MSGHSFTPGPWRLSPHYDGKGRKSPNRYSGIFEPIPGQDLGSRSSVLHAGYKGVEIDDIWLSIKDADARLISAAPDLYSALKFIMAFYEPGQRYLDTNAWKQAEASARAALLKAGRERA